MFPHYKHSHFAYEEIKFSPARKQWDSDLNPEPIFPQLAGRPSSPFGYREWSAAWLEHCLPFLRAIYELPAPGLQSAIYIWKLQNPQPCALNLQISAVQMFRTLHKRCSDKRCLNWLKFHTANRVRLVGDSGGPTSLVCSSRRALILYNLFLVITGFPCLFCSARTKATVIQSFAKRRSGLRWVPVNYIIIMRIAVTECFPRVENYAKLSAKMNLVILITTFWGRCYLFSIDESWITCPQISQLVSCNVQIWNPIWLQSKCF